MISRKRKSGLLVQCVWFILLTILAGVVIPSQFGCPGSGFYENLFDDDDGFDFDDDFDDDDFDFGDDDFDFKALTPRLSGS